MCGIVGILNINNNIVTYEQIRKMIAIVKHRGPDGFGFYRDENVALAHSRLSIIDIDCGWQPIHNENKSIWIIFNGEIFNYIELRKNLEDKGHSFYTQSDTEVIIHLYEEYGTNCLEYLNGQFAFAIWDKKNKRLFLARDRVGIRPLFYTTVGNAFIFASEIKSIFQDKRVKREIDPYALDQIFSIWMTIPPRTIFKDIFELPAGHFMIIDHDSWNITKYWDLEFHSDYELKSENIYAEQLRELLVDSTRLRLRADVPVGAYLSGGIDSSAITALIKKYTNSPLRTFSVRFLDETYDESAYQQEMIDYLNTDHSSITCSYLDIANIFPDVIWHTEKPILRTAPAPLFMLSSLVRSSNFKVVLTGEGADEVLAGYDIFKETKIRKFIERFPDSGFRPLILKRLYPYMKNSVTRSLQYAEKFFITNTKKYPAEFYSHILRWETTSKTKVFFSDHLKHQLSEYNYLDDLAVLLENIRDYDYLSQAQYLEMKTLLSGYLLSSQGDRVAMANSVETRFPFLDHRVIEYCCKLPPSLRMNVLCEKYVLKRSMQELLPDNILGRKKQPYMAPDSSSFFNGSKVEYLEELLSNSYLRKTGYFDPNALQSLINKCRQNRIIGFKDNMAIVGILSTLLTHKLFIDEFESRSTCLCNNVEEENIYELKV